MTPHTAILSPTTDKAQTSAHVEGRLNPAYYTHKLREQYSLHDPRRFPVDHIDEGLRMPCWLFFLAADTAVVPCSAS